MKRIILTLYFSLSIVSLYAQTIYKGKVTDTYNNPITGVSIVSTENNEKETHTDFDGNFSIELMSPKVKISNTGYQTKTITLSTTFNTIPLQKILELDEIIVSASREVQKRQEIPASIGLLTANQIKESKAFGIEQLVNQIPGVFMSTSKASSNEQHFMATRSPISTKSLFLYIEDGLPIRPVAVFNHNALLEMNSTTFKRIEVLKGPASSIYGSEAIGGSFNFITKNPRKDFGGSVGFQINDLGLTRYDAEASTTVNNKYGFYIGGHHVRRNNGPVGHSDYEKTAISFKNVNDFSESLQWTNMLTYIDYRSDMSGSISEENYVAGEYESNQTFTERDASALRFRSTLDKKWNEKNKTSFNFIYRDNEMDQIPSYRIRQDRNQGQLTGTGSGEINSNAFKSYVGLIQHKIDFDFAESSLIIGATTDFSPQDYVAENIDVVVDTNTAQNISYTVLNGDYILNYKANILNYAGYMQYEVSPFNDLKITGAIRYDGFTYDYDNLIENLAGVTDTKISYNNVSPKFGFNYNINPKSGFYGNYSKGFTPPQVSTLFRNSYNNSAGGTVFDLNPAKFNNYEVGGYFTIPSVLKVDVALYQLDGKDRLISLLDDSGNYLQKNAGKTRSRGVELSVKYNVLNTLSINYSGSYATHKYISFFDSNIDYSDTDMQTAPNYLAMASIKYKPIKGLSLTLEHEQVGKYNTSFEGQAIVGQDSNGDNILGTATYKGYSIFNFKVNYTYKNFEIWGQALNIFDELYAIRASYSSWSNENTYSVGNPRAFHFGIKYNF